MTEMNIIKISMLLRSSEIVWAYKKAEGGDFWDEVKSRIYTLFSEATTVHKKNGSFQHIFYALTDLDIDKVKEAANGIADALLPDKEQRGSAIVTVTLPDGKELRALGDSAGDCKLEPRYLEALDRQLGDGGTVKKESPEPDKRTAPLALKDEPKECSADNESAPEQRAAAAERKPLFSQAQRISELKAGLLSRIRGQRHAVDEMVESIFECEMFAAQNPKRKGPLATFLFTGPSGVGKTFLAESCAELLGRKTLVVDMSEYSDNLANNKFNGEHGQPAVVTGFVRSNPDGIIIFDEVEKAHINTIHLFLQILDAARLMDHQIKKEVSFKNNIIIMTTNAGKSLYDDATVCDLSGTPRSVILDALRTDKNPSTGEPYFPDCITTRLANGHVILFNHLEPFSLMEIVRDEIELQIRLFEESSGVKVEYDPKLLSALVLYNGGGIADARTLRGLAKNILVRELQEIVMQLFSRHGKEVDRIKNVALCINTEGDDEVGGLFVSRNKMYAAVFADGCGEVFESEAQRQNTEFEVINDSDLFKRRMRGVTDYVIIDPLCCPLESKRIPNDIEDFSSLGMQMFNYTREFLPEMPIYILDTAPEAKRSFETLLARGAKGVIELPPCDRTAFCEALSALSFNALINNAVYSLGRSGRFLSFNCAQYIEDTSYAVVSFEQLAIKSAPLASDGSMIARKGENNNLKFDGIIGCRAAKATLKDFCAALDNPRDVLLSGKRMPKGILLYGPPGTGKTMLAKAMANECDATFFPVSATSFFGSLVGETERNIRDIFKKARRYAPSVIFIDEVDAIARKRTASASTAHNEDALNTFLAEMDGFATDSSRPVFILAATNYELEGDDGRVLDPAFVRRFDSKILIPLPDTDSRYEFLAACLKKHGIHFGEDHEKILRNMAERTGGMNNADLEMMNAQYVRGLGDKEPDGSQYMEALDAFRFGEVNKMDPEHLLQTATHEAGHALVCRLCGTTPSFLTVVSRGNYGGFMESAGEKSGTYTFEELMGRVCRSLAGRVAEIEFYGDVKGVNTGASSDIKSARYFIRASLDDFAMGERLFAHWTAKEAEELIRQQYERTRAMIHEHRQTLERLANLLAEKKSLDQNQMEKFFASEGI